MNQDAHPTGWLNFRKGKGGIMQIIRVEWEYGIFYCPFSGEIAFDERGTCDSRFVAGVFDPAENMIWDVSKPLSKEMIALLRQDFNPAHKLHQWIDKVFNELWKHYHQENNSSKLKIFQEIERLYHKELYPAYHNQPHLPERIVRWLIDDHDVMPGKVFHYLSKKISDRFICYDLDMGNASIYVVFDTQVDPQHKPSVS